MTRITRETTNVFADDAVTVGAGRAEREDIFKLYENVRTADEQAPI